MTLPEYTDCRDPRGARRARPPHRPAGSRSPISGS